ncbi:MAG: hypothetical protein GQ575_00360 [Deltaproteobacteria bacterium]|nr:hypothetical protein [Deltaproteobacteria bacterium]
MDNNEHKPDGVVLPVKWGDVTKAPTVYANQLLISHMGSEFYLIFGEISAIFHGGKEQLPESLEIQPRVKIAITRKNMIAFAKVIQQNTQDFLDRVVQKQDDAVDVEEKS